MSNKNYGWDAAADRRLRELSRTNERAIPTIGGAVFAASAIKAGDLGAFCRYLLHVPSFVKEWEGGIVGAMNDFCHICLVDPMLIEVYLGITFAEIANNYEMKLAQIEHKNRHP